MQGLLADREGTPAQDPALAQALMQLAAQVHSAPADLAALLLDSIAACMQLEDEDRGDAGGCLPPPRGRGNWEMIFASLAAVSAAAQPVAACLTLQRR